MRAIALAVMAVSLQTAAVAGEDYCLVPEQERPADFREVCGTTVISGDEAGVARVYVPDGVTYDLDDFTIEVAEDRFAGFVLQQERSDSLVLHLVNGWRYPADMRLGELGAEEADDINLLKGGNVLPPGWYRFYLLTEPGVEAEVALRFGGLEGERRVRSEQPSTLKVSRLGPATTLDPHTYYAAAESGEIVPGQYPPQRPVGMAIVGVAWKGDLPGVSRLGVCHARGELRHEVLASSPSCTPAATTESPGSNGSFSDVWVANGDGSYASRRLVSAGHTPGTWTLSAFAQSAGETTSVAGIGVWISLD